MTMLRSLKACRCFFKFVQLKVTEHCVLTGLEKIHIGQHRSISIHINQLFLSTKNSGSISKYGGTTCRGCFPISSSLRIKAFDGHFSLYGRFHKFPRVTELKPTMRKQTLTNKLFNKYGTLFLLIMELVYDYVSD